MNVIILICTLLWVCCEYSDSFVWDDSGGKHFNLPFFPPALSTRRQYKLYTTSVKSDNENRLSTVSFQAECADPIRDLMKQGEFIMKTEAAATSSQSLKHSVEEKDTMKAIYTSLDQRMKARYERNYALADRIKDSLMSDYQVEIFDGLGIWRSANGLTGPIKHYIKANQGATKPVNPVTCPKSYEEVQELVLRRTECRRQRDYDRADHIRAQLSDIGIELLDKSNEWRSYDGRLEGVQSFDFVYSPG